MKESVNTLRPPDSGHTTNGLPGQALNTQSDSPTFSLVLYLHPTVVNRLVPLLPWALALLMIAVVGDYLTGTYDTRLINWAYELMQRDVETSPRETPSRAIPTEECGVKRI